MKYYRTSLDNFNQNEASNTFTRTAPSMCYFFIVYLVVVHWGLVDITALPLFLLVFALLYLALPGIAYFYTAQDYRLDKQTFYITRLIGPIAIELAEIKNIRLLSNESSKFSLGIKIFGEESFWGRYGYFWNRALGVYTLYAGNLKNPILITTYNGKYYVVSPDTMRLYADLQTAAQRQIEAAEET